MNLKLDLVCLEWSPEYVDESDFLNKRFVGLAVEVCILVHALYEQIFICKLIRTLP